MYCTVPIAYEGSRRNWEGKSPYAPVDAKGLGWAKTDLGVYGSGHIGLLSALIRRKKDMEGIIMWDCLETRLFHPHAYPTYLIHNPYSKKIEIEVDMGRNKRDIYVVVTHRFIKKGVAGRTKIYIKPSSAIVFFSPTGER